MSYTNISKKEINFLAAGNDTEEKILRSLVKSEKQTDGSAINLLVNFFQQKISVYGRLHRSFVKTRMRQID
jgi:hypothetical protein